MKFVQYGFCGFLLTLTAAAQTAPATPAPTPATQTAAPATQTAPGATSPRPPQLSTNGGDQVKGPEHPLTLDQMKELSAAMGFDKTIDKDLEANLARQRASASFVPADFWDDLESSFKKIDYSPALLDVYKKYISTEDAAKVIEFSKTDAGKHFLESTPAISREVPMAIQKAQQQVAIDVRARHKDELDAAIKKYREEHQPKPAATPAAPNSTTPSGSTAPAATPAPAKTATPPASSTTTTPAPAPTTPQN